MSTLPASGYLSDAARTEGQMKTALEAVRSCIAEAPGGAAETELTIASGSVTPTGATHTIDTESDAAADDLTNLAVTNHPEGRQLFLRAADAARVVTVKHNAGGSGQIRTLGAADFSLNDVDGYVILIRVGTSWYEAARGIAPATGGLASIAGVSNAGGNVAVSGGGSIVITANDGNNTIEISDEAHVDDTDNPHAVTADQVGSDEALWNAAKLQGISLSTTVPTHGQVMAYNSANQTWGPAAAAGSGGPTAYLMYNGVGNAILKQSGGITVTKLASGRYRINWATPFADTLYRLTLAVETFTTGDGRVYSYIYRGTQLAGSVEIITENASGSGVDVPALHVTAWA